MAEGGVVGTGLVGTKARAAGGERTGARAAITKKETPTAACEMKMSTVGLRRVSKQQQAWQEGGSWLQHVL